MSHPISDILRDLACVIEGDPSIPTAVPVTPHSPDVLSMVFMYDGRAYPVDSFVWRRWKGLFEANEKIRLIQDLRATFPGIGLLDTKRFVVDSNFGGYFS